MNLEIILGELSKRAGQLRYLLPRVGAMDNALEDLFLYKDKNLS